MSQEKIEQTLTNAAPLTSKSLAKQIFQAELPEQYIRTIPAQSLFTAIKSMGLHSAGDLIDIASVEQVRLLLDFDCWKHSYFDEENFWEWMSLPDDQQGLGLLQKILKSVDLKIIALVFARHIKYEFFEEATDSPPSPNSYTPDKGRTWINITIEDSNKHFLLGRLLALIFETNPDLFYQLLSLTTTSTESELEEQSYQDRSKRVVSEGIPDEDLAFQLNSPISENEVVALLKKDQAHIAITDIRTIEPLIYDSLLIQPLSSLLADLSIREDFEVELTQLMNAAIVRWQVELNDYEAIVHITKKVKGCLNIGLEKALLLGAKSNIQAFHALGARNLYRLGLEQLKLLRKKASSFANAETETPQIDNVVAAILSSAKLQFPEIPEFFKYDSFSEKTTESLNPSPTAIEHLKDIDKILAFLEKKLAIQIN